MNFSRNDVILVPIPFTDLTSQKVRPAVVIGAGTHPGDLFVVPITSQLPQTAFSLRGWRKAGLNVPCGIKGQIATIESRLIRKIVGSLDSMDVKILDEKLRGWLSL